MKSMYLHLPIVLVIYPSKSSHTDTAIVSASTVSMSDARLQSYSVNIVEVEVPCSANCVRYTHLEVVSYGQCKLVCFNSVHVR